MTELLSVVTAHHGFKGYFEIKKLKDPSRRHASIPLHLRALQGTCGWRAKLKNYSPLVADSVGDQGGLTTFRARAFFTRWQFRAADPSATLSRWAGLRRTVRRPDLSMERHWFWEPTNKPRQACAVLHRHILHLMVVAVPWSAITLRVGDDPRKDCTAQANFRGSVSRLAG